MKQGIILGVAVVVVVALGVGIYFLLPSTPSQPKAVSNPAATATATTSVSGGESDNAAYFSQDAKVMFFYSDTCHWCQQQVAVLNEIAKDGYKLKPMNVGTNQDYWKTYNISGTPTFVAPDGDTKVGYQADKAALEAWLDKYK